MSRTRESSLLLRLRDATLSPDDRRAVALAMVEGERDLGALRAALALLGADPNMALRRALLRRYAACEADPSRHDPGCFVRVALLETLRPVSSPEDAPLLARAVETVEWLPPGPTEVASGLRAAALVVLNEVDEELAGWQALRLLRDEHTSRLSGEPAVSAVRVLASQGQLLPLYDYALHEHAGPEGRVADVTAECLRSLTPLPAELVPPLAGRFLESRDEIVLLGLFDLLLNHPARERFLPLVLDFLPSTGLTAIYRYLVATLVANRLAIDQLEALLAREADPQQAAILREALALR